MGVLTIVIPIAAALLAGGAGALALMRKKGEKLYDKYDSFTKERLQKDFSLEPYSVKPEFKILHPAKAMKLIKIGVRSETGERLARVNALDATMMGFVKMYTLLIRPDYSYNLPVFSVDIIFIGQRRIFILELIDPAGIEDDNKNAYYGEMRQRQAVLEHCEASGTNSDWAETYLADCSVHIKADQDDDPLLFETYSAYLSGYLKMVAAASRLPDDQAEQMKAGLESYVTDLLNKGGPAVDVFKKLLGPEKQVEYVKTILFGM